MAKQNSMSHILSRWAVYVAITLGVLTSVVEATFDYFDEVKNIDAFANDILKAAEPSAGEATYQIDSNLAQEVLRGVFFYNIVESTKIIDDFGKELASFSRNETEKSGQLGRRIFGDIFNTYQVELRDPDKTRNTGYLQIVIDQNVALGDFYNRSILNLLIGCLKNALLLLVLFILFSKFIDKPLISLINEIDDVDPKNPEPIKTAVKTSGEENEIHRLKSATNRLLASSQQHLSELEDAQRKLESNETKLNDFAVAASDWFWETDADIRIISVSERFFEITGRENEEFVGQSFEEIATNEKMTESQIKELKRLTEARAPFRDFPMAIRPESGQPIYFSVSGLPYFLDNGEFGGFRGIGTDKTALVRSEKERKRLSEDLQHAQKLRAIGQLSGGISHDFNNLLAVILGNLELIKLEKNLSERAKGFLQLAIDATSRGAQLTRRLLAYSRQQPLSPEPINPGNLLVDLEDLLRRTIGEQIEMESVVSGGLWRCNADVRELETVILNLAINARDAMPEGGKLTIEVFNARLDREYAKSDDELSPGQYVCFALTDTGIGMDKQTAERAFDPYFTTKPAGVGSGLGLSMAYGFAKQSRGHIKIYSEVDKGTTVKLYLPRTMENTSSERISLTDESEIGRLQGLSVLVVEDQMDVRNTIRSQLEYLGCEVTEATDSDEALARCDEDREFDIFLLDVVLPGQLHGKDLSNALLNVMPTAEVVFMSGYTENSIVHNGQLDDAVWLLQKPFTSMELATILTSVLAERDKREDPSS